MLKVGIAGVTGYTGLVLYQLLCNHPEVSVSHLFSKQHIGKYLRDFYPEFSGEGPLLSAFEPEALPSMDVLFLALPHGQSVAFMEELSRTSCKIIDLSSDFRLNNRSLDASITGVGKAISLGFPELYCEDIAALQICSNPGCYVTSVVMALFPLSQAGYLPDTVLVDSKSGVSGAGKSLREGSLYCEVNESVTPYATFNHRHAPEMESVLSTTVLFSPHLVPMSRGILSSIYLDNTQGLTNEQLTTLFQDAYRDKPFVHLVPEDYPLSTRHTLGTNHCYVSVRLHEDSNKIVIFSVEDNLVKGASGQAIQNMNIMCGYDESLGLKMAPRIPS